MNDKILSIVIPTYNMERLLRKCLSSLVVKNNLNLLEVLVVNDGSKDSSSQIAHEFQYKYPKTFRVIDKDNGNYGSCVNRGLKEAKGKYIKILDADDSFDTIALDDYLIYLAEQNSDLILTDWCLINSEDNCTYSYHYPFSTNKVYCLKDMDIPMDFRMHGLTYKTSCLHKIGYVQTEGISYTDCEWCFMPMSVVKTISCYGRVLYKYLVGREGQTIDDTIHAKNYWMEVDILQRMIKQYVENKHYWSDDVRRYMFDSLMGRVKIVYEKVLVEFYGCYPFDKFAELDKLMQTYMPECIGITNAFHMYDKLPIHYVKIWRKHKHSNCIGLRLLRLYYHMKKTKPSRC